MRRNRSKRKTKQNKRAAGNPKQNGEHKEKQRVQVNKTKRTREGEKESKVVLFSEAKFKYLESSLETGPEVAHKVLHGDCGAKVGSVMDSAVALLIITSIQTGKGRKVLVSVCGGHRV